MASQTYAQRSESPTPKRVSHHFASLEHSLQHQNSTSPISSQDAQQNHAETSDTELTPPTSSSGLSSQERPIFLGQACPIPAAETANADVVYALMSKSTAKSPKSAGNFLETIAAPKRTSSGQVKRSTTSGADGPGNIDGVTSGHSRTLSLLSNGSSVTEVGFFSQFCLGGLTSPAAVTTIANSPFVCHGESSEWVGVEQSGGD